MSPKYFSEESAYVRVFPNRIAEILSKNNEAKVFCVFDMDTVHRDNTHEKHRNFVESLKNEIDRGAVVLCDSMPSFEFWLLLHFVDYDGLLKDYREISNVLSKHIKLYFEHSDKKLKQLLKSKKHLARPGWVKRLLSEGRIELAVQNAKSCMLRLEKSDGKQSYSNVYKIFDFYNTPDQDTSHD